MPMILVVDDDPDVRRMVTRLLVLHDFGAVAAETTEEAVRALASGRIDAVLLDVVLGQENGWETVRRIRETSAVPVVMMSGATMDGDSHKDADVIGAQGVLQKPFESHELFDCLARVLGAPPAP
ncbi:response regulator [bacterium]|nr:MAG: response regulator [bacterium]